MYLTDPTKSEDFLLDSTEQTWVEMQPFLLKRGYRLRPRYDPDWIPSWLTAQVPPGGTAPDPTECEDGLTAAGHLMDAVRVKDGLHVVFKRVPTNTDEISIAMYLSSEKNRGDRRNRAVPILDVIMIPGTDEKALLVMPYLLRFHLLPFRFLGEFCEFSLQILEGLEFMHRHNIAHRDACWNNLMMDTTNMVPKGHHFRRWNSHDGLKGSKFEWKTRWSVRPVQYYLIDYGLSTRCKSNVALVLGALGQDKSVPEFRHSTERGIPYNPFPVDVYHFGNVLKRCIEEYKGLDAFTDLADVMTRQNPRDRPTIYQSVEICKNIIADITRTWNLNSRVWKLDKGLGGKLTEMDKLKIILGQNPPY